MAVMPRVFVSHGAPSLFLEPQPTRTFLQELGQRLPRPDAVLCVSAHWTTRTASVTLATAPETLYDFYGFADELYDVRYPAPGAPDLAAHVLDLLDRAGIQAQGDANRGLDHGAWVPLGLMYPQGDVPVVQLSVQPDASPASHADLGRALSPLAGEGVLVLGSGGATHNLRDTRWQSPDMPPADYAAEFDAWLEGAVLGGRIQDLENYLAAAPQAARNHPTPEHYLPLLVPAAMGGAARKAHGGFAYGVLSMAAFVWE